MVRSAWKWAHYSHLLVGVGWIFVLYGLVYHRALVPRPLAVIGFVTAMLQVTGITLPVLVGYRMPHPVLFGMPLGVANLALALWLMARGFKEPQDALHAEAVPT